MRSTRAAGPREDRRDERAIATGLARTDAGVDSFAEAASRAALQLGGAPADLAVVFAGAANLGHAEEGLAAVQGRLHARALLGCGAQGVVGDGRELEEGGVVVWAASLPGAGIETFHLETVPTSETAVAVAGMPELDGADAAIVLVDPYTFPIDPVLAQLADDQPGLPVVGGLASAGGPGMAVLMHDDEVARRGAVGVALSSGDVRVCVSQGARPIGPEMAITAAEGNVIHELASQPALERLRTAIAELDPGERALASQGLLLGIVIDPQPARVRARRLPDPGADRRRSARPQPNPRADRRFRRASGRTGPRSRAGRGRRFSEGRGGRRPAPGCRSARRSLPYAERGRAPEPDRG